LGFGHEGFKNRCHRRTAGRVGPSHGPEIQRPANVAEAVADLLEGTGFELEAAIAGLEAAGYMEKVRVDNDGAVWWGTTIEGDALAMANFGQPIRRKTADRLVYGLLERGRNYNTDPGKPMFINTLRVLEASSALRSTQ
jgi:hypothetical protein